MEDWFCPRCENIFVVLDTCATCGSACRDTAVCPRCGAILRRPPKMVFFAGMEDE